MATEVADHYCYGTMLILVNSLEWEEISSHIALPLTHVFNSSFSSGLVPHKLKIAEVIHKYKSNDPQMFCNYRPI